MYQNVERFIRSKTNIWNVAIFKYSWHEFGETILRWKYNLSHEKSYHVWQYVTRVYDDAEKWSIYQTDEVYFIWSNTDVMHFVTVKYSLQQSDKTVLH